jgi:hypothetical protein
VWLMQILTSKNNPSKKLRAFLIIGIFLISLIIQTISISAISVDFSCPEEVKQREEFTCKIKTTDIDSNYDFKFDAKINENRALNIYTGEFWGSTYYYLKNKITPNQETEIQFQASEELYGTATGFLRLRKTGKSDIDYQEEFSIKIIEDKSEEKEQTQEEEKNSQQTQIDQETPSTKQNKNQPNKNIIRSTDS